jgi:twitching motility two-component system response regulator PilH
MTIKNILVVDDSPTERAALAEILARNNFAVTMAENGEEAITKAKERTPDLILMDVVMPGLNGFQATARCPETQPPNTSRLSSVPPGLSPAR